MIISFNRLRMRKNKSMRGKERSSTSQLEFSPPWSPLVFARQSNKPQAQRSGFGDKELKCTPCARLHQKQECADCATCTRDLNRILNSLHVQSKQFVLMENSYRKVNLHHKHLFFPLHFLLDVASGVRREGGLGVEGLSIGLEGLEA